MIILKKLTSELIICNVYKEIASDMNKKTNIQVSPVVKAISPSGTIEVKDKVRALSEKGINVISFATGEPDFDTPKNIKEAAYRAIDEGFTKYPPVSGIKELKNAISNKYKIDNLVLFKEDEIIVSNGAKQVLYELLLSTCSFHDKVMIPTPCWVSYPEQVKMVGASPLYAKTNEKDNFSLKFKDIQDSYNKDVKIILLNNPNNPSGSVYDKEELKKIGYFALENNILLVIDEIYEKLVYEDNFCSLVSLDDEFKNICFTVNGFSKTYAMTGWRIGYGIGPKRIIKSMNKLQGHISSGVNSIAQKAAVEALMGPQDFVAVMKNEYMKRRDYMVEKLNSIRNINCKIPMGSFYVFPNISGLYGGKYNDEVLFNEADVVNYLLEEAHVAAVPGSVFHYNDHIRLTYAISFGEIKEGLNRIEDAIKKLCFK